MSRHFGPSRSSGYQTSFDPSVRPFVLIAMPHNSCSPVCQRVYLVVFAMYLGICSREALAQDRLKSMPGYDRYQKMSREITNAVKLGALSVTWKDRGNAFEFQKDNKRYRYD